MNDSKSAPPRRKQRRRGAPAESPMESILAGLQTLEEYQLENQRQFPSLYALHWKVRNPEFRALAVASGGLVLICKRLFIVPDRFSAAVLEDGARRLAARLDTARAA